MTLKGGTFNVLDSSAFGFVNIPRYSKNLSFTTCLHQLLSFFVSLLKPS